MNKLICLLLFITFITFQLTNGQFVQAPEQLSGITTLNYSKFHQFLGLLPTELINFYNSLTPRQEKIMDQAVNGNDGNEEGFLEFVYIFQSSNFSCF